MKPFAQEIIRRVLIGLGIFSIIKWLTKFRRDIMKFEIFKDKAGEWRFNLLANNYKVVCSSEGYSSKRNALNGIECIMKGAKKAKIEERLE